MGRFASTVEFYARYREPYPLAFFSEIAHHLALSHREALLDVGCGPAPLAIGLSPFVAHCTGIDPEAAMIAAASTAAAQAGVSLALVHTRLEDFSPTETFDIVTIGRALHWLDRTSALPLLQRMTSPSARILICGAATVDSPGSPWKKPYDDLRHCYCSINAWALLPDEALPFAR
jgi:ubiquinone/menaquinone biosynthesis C-methylase UbiE